MAASSTDLFRKSFDFTSKTLSAGIDNSTGTIPLNNTTNIPTDTAVTFIIDRVDSNEVSTPSVREVCTGVVSGSSIISCTRGQQGTSAQVHALGAVVEFVVSAEIQNDLVDGLLVSHDQDGTLKAGAVDVAAVLASDVVTTAKILDSNVTTAKIADSNVTAAKLATNAITLGYAQITAGFANSSTTIVAITGLSVAVTIPAGGRKVRITAWGGAFTAGSNTTPSLYICDGTTATVLAYNQASIGGAGFTVPAHAVAIVTPAAGAKTYLLGMSNTAGVSTTLNAAVNQPAFILVETI